jgi:hypothetical protein
MSKNLTGKPVDLDGSKSATAKDWKEEKAEKPELYRFSWPKSVKSEPADGVMTIVPAPDAKGDEVLEALKKEFEPSKGTEFAEDDIPKAKTAKAGNVEVTLYEVNGTYKKGASPMPKYRGYAALLEIKGKKYLVKAVGPGNIMRKNGSDFKAWLAAFK